MNLAMDRATVLRILEAEGVDVSTVTEYDIREVPNSDMASSGTQAVAIRYWQTVPDGSRVAHTVTYIEERKTR